MPSSVEYKEERGCRVKINAKVGGSPVWFLPVPGTKLKTDMFGKCIKTNCEIDEWKSQRIGFSEDSFYNCQPLSFEVMTIFQRRALLDKLYHTGVAEEYGEDLAAAGFVR